MNIDDPVTREREERSGLLLSSCLFQRSVELYLPNRRFISINL